MKNIWTSKSININTKRQIFKSSVITILLYGCETWLIEQNTLKSLDVFANNCYRVMLSYKRIDHITIEKALENHTTKTTEMARAYAKDRLQNQRL